MGPKTVVATTPSLSCSSCKACGEEEVPLRPNATKFHSFCLYRMEWSSTREQKIEAMRRDLANNPELLTRFNEIHPPPVPPQTLVDALTNTAKSSDQDLAAIPPAFPWYGLRHKFKFSCALEARLHESSINKFL